MNYKLSYPAVNGEVVTQGHADYCAEHGHAKHTIDGVVSPLCPRCGADKTSEVAAVITFTPCGAGHAIVNMNNRPIGDASRKHGFIHYRTRDRKITAVIKSTDSTFAALTYAIMGGIENGRDDRDVE